MRHLLVGLISVWLLSGCMTNQKMQDIIDNQYEDKKIYADAGANYVGEWVGDEKSSLMPMKIKKDGNILMCATKKNQLNVNGKVYLENGKTMFIFEGGSKYTLESVENNVMILNYYGDKDKYYLGTVPDKCLKAFKDFE